MQRRIVWVSTFPLDKTPRGLTSDRASIRYRMTIPSAALGESGYDSRITYIAPNANRSTLLQRFDGALVVIVGKLLYAPPEYAASARRLLDLVGALRDRGVKVIADFSDDVFLDELRGASDTALANSVDAAVASTPGLAEVLRGVTPVPVSVVTDPVEGRRGEPRAPAGEMLSLLWFGHWTNIDTLKGAAAQLANAPPHSLTVMSNTGFGAEELAAELDEAWRARGNACRFRPWSVDAAFEALAACDAVVIPSNPFDPRKAIKSPNRFTESVWAGRFVVAHPLPAYEPLADFGWVGEDLGEGLRWLAERPGEALDRMRRGQAAIAERYAPAVVAGEWARAIEAVLGGAG